MTEGNREGKRTPARVKRTLAPRDYLTIAALAATGARELDIARRLRMHRDTWRRIRDEDESAREAFEAGRAELHEELMSKLLVQAKAGNVPCLLFALKILYGYRENNPVPSEIVHNVRIELPAALSPDQYAKARLIESSVALSPDQGFAESLRETASDQYAKARLIESSVPLDVERVE